MRVRASATLSLLAACVGPRAVPQTIAIEGKPPGTIVAKGSDGKVAATIPIAKGGHLVGSVASLDGQLLIVLLWGRRGTGQIDIVDLAKGAVASRPAIDHPTELLRLGEKRKLWVLGGDVTMQSLSEAGEPEEPMAFHLGGYAAAGQAIGVGADRVAISLVGKNGLRYQVALIDLKQRRLDGVVGTRSAGQKTKLGITHFNKDVLRGMSRGGQVVYHTTYVDYSLLARPDGRFVYAVDFGTREVAVIDVPTTTKVATIQLDGPANNAQLSADGKELIITGKQVQRIDLESNKIKM